MKLDKQASGARLAVFDIDGTLYRGLTQRDFLKLLSKEGILSWNTAATIYAMFALYTLGMVRDTKRLREMAYRPLAGMSRERIAKLLHDNAGLFAKNIFDDSRMLIEMHRANDDRVLALSASLEMLIRPICSQLGIDDCVCTILEEVNGRFTGRILGDPLTGEAKLSKLKEYVAHNGPFGTVFYYADSMEDLPILEFVDMPVCVNPSPQLSKVARSCGWTTLEVR